MNDIPLLRQPMRRVKKQASEGVLPLVCIEFRRIAVARVAKLFPGPGTSCLLLAGLMFAVSANLLAGAAEIAVRGVEKHDAEARINIGSDVLLLRPLADESTVLPP
jgi:hypothetical protein